MFIFFSTECQEMASLKSEQRELFFWGLLPHKKDINCMTLVARLCLLAGMFFHRGNILF